MSKFQPEYNKAKKKEIRTMVPEIDKEIQELQDAKQTTTNNDIKKGIDARIKALNIKKQSYRKGDPVKEDASMGAISTGSIGSPSMVTSDGGTVPAAFGSSYIQPKHQGTLTRYKKDAIKAPSKKKKTKSFQEVYFN